jgi:hypothetical protein
MYALERNAWKFKDRDKRTEKIQHIEYSYLAPDTINEMFDSIEILSKLKVDGEGNAQIGDIENSKRITEIVKIKESIDLFRELICYYGTVQLINHIKANKFSSFDDLKKSIPVKISRNKWRNIGGQLIPASDVEKLKDQIKTSKIDSWKEVHEFYHKSGEDYEKNKLIHAYTSLLEIENITSKQFTAAYFKQLLERSVVTKTWASKAIYESRAKDYSNPFRKMIYENAEEMNTIMGKLEDNHFIQDQFKDLDAFKKTVKGLIKKYVAKTA